MYFFVTIYFGNLKTNSNHYISQTVKRLSKSQNSFSTTKKKKKKAKVTNSEKHNLLTRPLLRLDSYVYFVNISEQL